MILSCRVPTNPGLPIWQVQLCMGLPPKQQQSCFKANNTFGFMKTKLPWDTRTTVEFSQIFLLDLLSIEFISESETNLHDQDSLKWRSAAVEQTSHGHHHKQPEKINTI